MSTATEKKLRNQAHGMTADALAEHQLDQNEGSVKMSKAATKKSDGGDYMFPANEKHLVHVEIWTPQYNSQTGIDEGSKIYQSFYPKEFDLMSKEKAFAGSKVTVLHDPKGTAEDVNPGDHLKANVMSQPGAGTPLNPNAPAKEYGKMSVPELQAERESLYADGKSKDFTQKKALIDEIEAKLEFDLYETILKTIEKMDIRADETNEAFEERKNLETARLKSESKGKK